jgi:hypothetical protein
VSEAGLRALSEDEEAKAGRQGRFDRDGGLLVAEGLLVARAPALATPTCRVTAFTFSDALSD